MASLRIERVMLGKAMVAQTKPQERKKEESERFRKKRDQIKFTAYIQQGVANLPETKSRNFPCAAQKSHLRHVGTHAPTSSTYF